MAETDVASPWGPRDPSEATPALAPGAAPASPTAPRSWVAGALWGALSTAILAAWIALWAGWAVALALVAGVFVHEFGHVLVINWAGCGPSSIRIIPFFGGAATLTRNPESDFKAVLIALAGPVFGLLAAAPLFAGAAVTHDPTWLACAFMIGALNLVNLAPAAPLDGAKALGPVLARIHPLLEQAVLILVAGAALVWAIWQGSLIFGAAIALAAVRAFAIGRFRAPARPLSLGEWAASLALYLGAILLCAAVIFAAVRDGGVIRFAPLFGGAFQ